MTIYSNKDFEDKIQKFLLKTKKMVLSNLDIKNRFGYNININHFIELDNICLCFRDIYKKSQNLSTHSSIDIQQFINDVTNITNIMQKRCIGIIISTSDIPYNEKYQLEQENNKPINQYITIYDNTYGQMLKFAIIANRLLEFHNNLTIQIIIFEGLHHTP